MLITEKWTFCKNTLPLTFLFWVLSCSIAYCQKTHGGIFYQNVKFLNSHVSLLLIKLFDWKRPYRNIFHIDTKRRSVVVPIIFNISLVLLQFQTDGSTCVAHNTMERNSFCLKSHLHFERMKVHFFNIFLKTNWQ